MAHVGGLPVVQHLKANLIGNIADSVFNEGRVGISEKPVPYIAFSVTLKNDIGMGELIDQTIKCLIVGDEPVAWWKLCQPEKGDVVVMNNVALYFRDGLAIRIFNSSEFQILKAVAGKTTAEKKQFDICYADDFFKAAWTEKEK